MIFNKPKQVQSSAWIDEGKKVFTERFRFNLQFKANNDKLSAIDAKYLHDIIKQNTLEDKKNDEEQEY